MTSPTPGADRERPKRADLLLPWEIVVAPARAFERIAVLPEWMVAYSVSAILMCAGTAISYQAIFHVQNIVNRVAHEAPVDSHDYLGWLLVESAVLPLVNIMMYAIGLACFAATRDVKNFAKYPQFVSLTACAQVIASLGQFAEAIAIRLHDARSFVDVRSLDMAFPQHLTFFANKANPGQVNFLSHFGFFETWTSIVLAYGFARIANVGVVPALIFIFSLDLTFALLTV